MDSTVLELKYKLGERLDALDILSDNYDFEYERIQAQIDDTYDAIEEIESKISKCKKRMEALKKGEKSVENIKTIMRNFLCCMRK